MALTFSGTTGSIASGASATIAHGLGTQPDWAFVQEITPAAIDGSLHVTSVDATNVIIYNNGATASITNAVVKAIILHTLIS